MSYLHLWEYVSRFPLRDKEFLLDFSCIKCKKFYSVSSREIKGICSTYLTYLNHSKTQKCKTCMLSDNEYRMRELLK